jgi:hypothetical protein
MKKFGGLFAKARNGSINFIFKEFAKEFFKQGAKWVFNFVVNNAHQLPEYIEHIIINSSKHVPM